MKLPNQQYVVSVVAPHNTTEESLLAAVQQAISADSSIKSVNVTSTPAALTSFQLRFPGGVAGDFEKLEAHFKEVRESLCL